MTLLGIIKFVSTAGWVVSLIMAIAQFQGFFQQLKDHWSYERTMTAAVARGDTFAVNNTPPVAAPDLQQWASWIGPGLLALVSFAISSWVKNPALQSMLQNLLNLLQNPPKPDDTQPLKSDGQGNQGPPAGVETSEALEKFRSIKAEIEQLKLDRIKADVIVQPKSLSLFTHLEALCANVPDGGEIFFQMTTADGLQIEINGKVVKS